MSSLDKYKNLYIHVLYKPIMYKNKFKMHLAEFMC